MDFEAVRSKVQGPAMALIVFGTLTLLLQFLSICGGIANMAGLLDSLMASMADQGMYYGGGGGSYGIVSLLLGVVGIAQSALIIFGGVKMRSVQSYSLCMVGAVVPMLPCNSGTCCCCIIGLIPGIWSIMTLMNADVKAAFEQGGAAPVNESW